MEMKMNGFYVNHMKGIEKTDAFFFGLKFWREKQKNDRKILILNDDRSCWDSSILWDNFKMKSGNERNEMGALHS